MGYVRSVRALGAELRQVVQPQEIAEPERLAGKRAAPPQPIAIVAVHGISPIQQYAFQDQFATGLQSYLNAVEQSAGSERRWRMTTSWPRVTRPKSGDTPMVKP